MKSWNAVYLMPVILSLFFSSSITWTATSWTSTTDVHKLSIGDGRVTTTGPMRGYVYVKTVPSGGGGAFKNGEWIKSDGTFDLTQKAVVDGNVSWPSSFSISLSGSSRIFTGNKLPNHNTGVYPIASTDDAYNYDRNPNSIKSQTLQISLPANPQPAAKPSPLPMGAIGIMKSGSVLFNALDGQGNDAVAHEIQDKCDGHPELTGEYHYHSLSNCIEDPLTGAHSPLLGYALDGFGIFGKYGENGKLLSNNDLDELHGHVHSITWDGKQVMMYHYHATSEYPYTLGGYKGTPVNVSTNSAGNSGNNGNCSNLPPPPPGAPPPPGGMCPPAQLKDTTAPTVPNNLNGSGLTSTSVKLTWQDSTDNTGISGYKVYKNGQLFAQPKTNSLTLNGLQAKTTYKMSVAAYDAAGNESAKSSELSLTTLSPPDKKAPTPPGKPQLTLWSKTALGLKWSASTDNVGVSGYAVYVNGKLFTNVANNFCTLSKLSSGSPYSISIKAYDAAGNRSPSSIPLTIKTAK